MARPASRHPTELELEILKIIWRDGPLPVKRVRDALAAFRDLAITSVTTTMNIMVKKGYLRKAKTGGSFVYAVRISRLATTRRTLQDVAERFFDGSLAAMVAGLLETRDLDEDEVKEIQKLLDRHKRE
jgi:predicted transcriptional regulator